MSRPTRAELEGRMVGDLVQIAAGMVLFSHTVSERLGLGPTDSQFLTLLRQRGSLTPGELARLSGLGTGTVTGVIDRLERAGYARRDRDPNDRRKVIVSPDLARIDSEIAPLYAGQAKRFGAMLRDYDARQVETIADFLGRMAREPLDPDSP